MSDFHGRSLRSAAFAASLSVVFLSLLALSGFFFEAPFIASLTRTSIPMAPSTAACFLILASALLFENSGHPRGYLALRAGAAAVLAICAASVIDRLTEQHATGSIPLWHMSPFSAALFLLAAGCFLRRSARGEGPDRYGLTAAAALAALSFLVLIGYIYGNPFFYGGHTIPISFPTGAAFLALSAALLASDPNSLKLTPFYGDSAEAVLFRNFLPLTAAAVLLNGLLNLGERSSLLGKPAMNALSALVAMGVAAWLARRVSRSVGERLALAQKKQLESDQIFSEFMEHSPIYVFFKDENIRSLRLSRNFEKMLGRPLPELLGKSMDELFPSDLAKKMMADDMRILREGKEVSVEEKFNGRNYVTTKFPINIEGKPTHLAGYTIDTTEQDEAKERLARSNERLTLAARAAGIGVWDWDIPADRLSWDDRMYELYGVSKDAPPPTYEMWLGKVHPEDRAAADEASRLALTERRQYDTEFRLAMENGKIRHIKAVADVFSDTAGKPVRMVGVNIDITEGKTAKQKLQESEEQLRVTLEETQIGTWAWDVKNDTWQASSTYYTMLGYPPVTGPGDRSVWLERVHPDDRKAVGEKIRGVLGGADAKYQYEARMLHADGSYRWHAVLGNTVSRDERGMPLRIVGVRLDINERKLAEEALRRNERGLREAQRLAHIGNWELDLTTNKLEWSDEIYRIFELDREKFGASYDAFLDAIHPEDRDAVDKAYTESLKNKNKYTITHRLRMKDGRVKHVSEFCETFYDAAGKPLKSIGTVQDITERVRLEKVNAARIHLMQFASGHSLDELLEETLNKAEELSDSVIGFYHFLDEDQQNLTLQNWSTRTKTRFCSAKGKGSHYPVARAGVWADCVQKRGPVIHNDYASLPNKKGLPEGHAPVVREMVVPVMRGGVIKAIMGVGNKPCGYDQDDLDALGMLADLAWETVERKLAEEAVEASEKRFRQLFETMEEGFATHEILCDEGGKPVNYRFLDVNPAFERLTGLKGEDLRGKTVLEVMPATEKSWIEAYGRVALEGTSLQMENFSKELGKWFEVTAFSPKHGQFAVSFFDVTARKRAELEMEKLNKELLNKNQEMENFLYITTHDLRSPLVNIQGFSRNLKGYLEEFGAVCGRVSGLPDEEHAKIRELFTQKAPEALGFILDSSRKMDALITALLKVSRAGRVEMKPERVETGEVVRKLLDAMRFQLQETGAKVRTGTLPACQADPGALSQVFANLLDNAVKYRDKSRQPAIEITGERLGDKTVYTVADNGPGIPAGDLDRIWNVFYAHSRPAAGRGEGIGLPMVKRLLDKNFGAITVSSKEGAGTTFRIELPAPAED